jgi:hypothetical protein
MAKDKKGFVLYADQKELFDQLPNDKAGELIKHIFAYVNDEDPQTDDILIKLAFTPIKQALKRDLIKYSERCQANKVNGKKGGRPKGSVKNPEKPNGYLINPTEPKKADNDKDKDNDSVKDNVKDIKEETIVSGTPKSKKDKDEKSFELIWVHYHKTTGRKKEDKEPALKHWVKLGVEEQRKAYANIPKWYNSLPDNMKENKQFIKKFRTFLSDKNYNDDFEEVKASNVLPKHNPFKR